MDGVGAELAVVLLIADGTAPALAYPVASVPVTLSLTQFALAMWWLNSVGVRLECVGSNGSFGPITRVEDLSPRLARH